MTGRPWIALALVTALLACSRPMPTVEAAGDLPTYPEVPAAAHESVHGQIPRVLGATASLAADRSPNTFRGDFNGDGVTDLLALVTPRANAGDLPAAVQLVRPWPLNAGVTPSDDLTRGARIGLAVVHGATDGAPEAAFLLHDLNPISILDTDAARELFVVAHKQLDGLEEPKLAASAHGDVIVVPTEAGIDTYIYWTGSTYRLFESADLP